MNKIHALREKRANLWNETKAFLDSHRGEDGMISAEDNATYEKMEADVVALGKEIERLERQAVIDRELDQPTASPLVSRPTVPTDRKQGRASDEYHNGNRFSDNRLSVCSWTYTLGRSQQASEEAQHQVALLHQDQGNSFQPCCWTLSQCF